MQREYTRKIFVQSIEAHTKNGSGQNGSPIFYLSFACFVLDV